MRAKPSRSRGAGARLLVLILGTVAGCAQAPANQVEAGRAIYQERCATCHGPDRQGSDTGPALAEVVSADIRRAVTEGIDENPSYPAMAPLPLTAGQLDAVVAFLTEPDGSG